MAYDWGQGFKGAGGGALAGAGLGGPVGAVAGGLIGGAAGLFGGGPSAEEKQNRKMLLDYYNQVQNRQAPQMGPAAQGSYSNFRGNQSQLIDRLDAMSRGQGPSLAAEQFKANTDRLNSQQASFANSGRGGPLGAMQAANNMSLQGSQASQGAVQGRIAEQMGALDKLGLNIHGARSADEDMNRFNAGQTNDAAQANLAARLKAMGLNDAAIQQTLSQLGGKAASEAQRPGMGDSILAGGAGLYSLGTSQRAQSRVGGQSMPQGGGINEIWRRQLGS